MTIHVLVAGPVALGGIIVMAGAVATSRDLLGIVAAFAMASGFAMQLVHTKRRPAQNTTVPIALAATVCAPVSTPFVQGGIMQGGIPVPTQLLACALCGVFTTGLAHILALKGGRPTSSGEADLISILDIVLGPFWVWLFYAERPTIVVLVGGSVVLASVAWYLSAGRLPEGSVPSLATLVPVRR